MFRPIIRQPIIIKGIRSSSTTTAGNPKLSGFRETVSPPLPSSSAFPAQIKFFFFYDQWRGIMDPPHPQNRKLFDQVRIPTNIGQVTIHPGHPTTHVVLKPGIVSLVSGENTTKYFINGGFAFIHAPSRVDVATDQEAIPLDHFDPDVVQKGLADFTQMLSSASTDLEKAEAQIGLEIHSTLYAALQETVQEEGPGTSKGGYGSKNALESKGENAAHGSILDTA